MASELASRILERLGREVWLVTAASGARRGGLIATFVMPVSIVAGMPRVALALSLRHDTTAIIEESRAFALHLLRADQLDWVRHFGLRSGRTVDKFEALSFETGSTGAPLLRGALAWLECRVEAALDAGDRMIYLAEVVESRGEAGGDALTVAGLIEGADPALRIELEEQLRHDAEQDAAAIRRWREGGRIDRSGAPHAAPPAAPSGAS